MDKTKRILILGGGGTLGHKLWQLLPSKFPDTFVTIRKNREFYSKCGLFTGPKVIDGLDLVDFTSLKTVLDELKPAVIVNCAGITLRREDSADKVANIAVNALLPHRLAAWCSGNGARLIHISTDCVFDGSRGNYDEETASDAKTLYGRTKFLGEVNEPCAVTLRTSFIGRELLGGEELLEWFLAQAGGRVKGYRKVLFTGLTSNKLAEVVGDIIGKFPALNGLYHVASEVISKYALLGLMNEIYKTGVEIEPDDGIECRRDLNGARFAKATGFVCPPWRQLMAEMAGDKTPYGDWRK